MIHDDRPTEFERQCNMSMQLHRLFINAIFSAYRKSSTSEAAEAVRKMNQATRVAIEKLKKIKAEKIKSTRR